MTRPIGSIVSAAFTAALVAFGGAMLSHSPASAVEDCIAAPKSPAPQGSHWYYRTDREKQRKCWYLGPKGLAIHKAAPRAASRVEPVAKSPALPSAEPTDNTVMGFPPTQQPAPTSSPASTPGDVWNTATIALQNRDQPNPIEVVENDATAPSETTAQAPSETVIQDPAPRSEVRVKPPVIASIQTTEPPTSAPLRLLLFIAGVLAVGAFVLTVALKIIASERRQRLAVRPAADRSNIVAPRGNIVAPRLAPSIFDIREVPPLPPIGHTETSTDDPGQLLRKLLRHLDQNAGTKALVRSRSWK